MFFPHLIEGVVGHTQQEGVTSPSPPFYQKLNQDYLCSYDDNVCLKFCWGLFNFFCSSLFLALSNTLSPVNFKFLSTCFCNLHHPRLQPSPLLTLISDILKKKKAAHLFENGSLALRPGLAPSFSVDFNLNLCAF